MGDEKSGGPLHGNVRVQHNGDRLERNWIILGEPELNRGRTYHEQVLATSLRHQSGGTVGVGLAAGEPTWKEEDEM